MNAQLQDMPAGINRMRGTKTSGKSGFTLMEVALAVSVVVIGLMALFALVSSGLDSSTKAVRDTQAAIFADNVYNGLRATSQAMAELGTNQNQELEWRVFWRDFALGQTSLTVTASSIWNPDYAIEEFGRFDIKANLWKRGARGGSASYDLELQRLRFDNVPQHDTASSSDPLVNHALRYRLEIRPGNVIDWNTTDLVNTNLSVTLFVWPGEFGSTNDPIIFYSEFDDAGDL
jgi:type II secretory pathway component PulJ